MPTWEQWAEAEAKLRDALTTLRGMPPYAAPALSLYMKSLRAQSKIAEAMETARAAAATLDNLGGIGNGEIRLRVAMAETFRAGGDEPACQHQVATALTRLDVLANEIEDPSIRERYLSRATIARLRELATPSS